MENQYNYYTTDQNMNTGNYGGGGEPGKEPQKKRGKGAARWAKVVCAGLVFGVVASAAFQTSNIVTVHERISNVSEAELVCIRK